MSDISDMFSLSIPGWLKLAGGIAAIHADHGADIATLKQDAPKAMSLAKDVVALIAKVHAEEPKSPISKAHPAAPSVTKVSVHTATDHVSSGISEAEQRIFDRASQTTG